VRREQLAPQNAACNGRITRQHRLTGMTRLAGALLCVSLLLCGTSSAQTTSSEDKIEKFLRSDRDHRVSYDEFVESIAAKMMRDLDTNRDNAISRAEAQAATGDEDAGVPVIGYIESDSSDGQMSLEVLRREIAASAKVRHMYDDLEKEWAAQPVGPEVASVRVLPQIRIRF